MRSSSDASGTLTAPGSAPPTVSPGLRTSTSCTRPDSSASARAASSGDRRSATPTRPRWLASTASTSATAPTTWSKPMRARRMRASSSRPGSVMTITGWSGRTTSPAYSAKRPSNPTLTAPTRWPTAKVSGSRPSIITAPSSTRRSASSTDRRGVAASSSSRSRSRRLVVAANTKYGGATGWPEVTASTKASSVMGDRAGLVRRCSPMVERLAVDRFLPQAEPAPWDGKTMVSSGRVSSWSCSERNSLRARSSAVHPIEVSRSGRPTSPMNRASPVSTAHGASSPGWVHTTIEIDSGVWPGVWRTSRRTSPRSRIWPSDRLSMGNSASAPGPNEMVAPVASASSRCPDRKSAWKCVSMTRSMVSPWVAASARYWLTSRWGSTTTARPVVSSPIR